MESVEYLIVGGGLTGALAATAIRDRDPNGRIVMVTEEPHLPYDRVPLSKTYLTGAIPLEKIFVKREEYFVGKKIEILKGRRVTKLDKGARTATLSGDDRQLQFGKSLLATGGRTRRLGLPGEELKGVHYLRTIEDCDGIKGQMSGARKAVVVGGGFIGCELAAAFASAGIKTTVLEVMPTILNVALDAATANIIEDYMVGKGVKVMKEVKATKIVGSNGRVTGVETSAGLVEADLVAIGVGIIPNTELAEGAGLKVDKGIVVNEFLETDAPGIYAGGDVARFFSPFFGHSFRVEHYDVAIRHGKVAGANMAGDRKPFTDAPYFFSHMFGLVIDVYGDMTKRDHMVSRGGKDPDKGFMHFYVVDDKVKAVLCMNKKFDEIQAARKIIASAKPVSNPDSLSDLSRDLGSFS